MEAMQRFELGELATLLVGLVALFIGGRLRQAVPLLGRIDMPNAVVGALVVLALVLCRASPSGCRLRGAHPGRAAADLLHLDRALREALRAQAAASRSDPLRRHRGGADRADPAARSSRRVGRAPGLWGARRFAVLRRRARHRDGLGEGAGGSKGSTGANMVAVGAATLAMVCGALVSGPVSGWIIKRHGLAPRAAEPAAPSCPPRAAAPPRLEKGSRSIACASVFVVALAVMIGEKLNDLAAQAGLLLPGFLSAMIAGVIITNVADAVGFSWPSRPSSSGALALQVFLVWP